MRRFGRCCLGLHPSTHPDFEHYMRNPPARVQACADACTRACRRATRIQTHNFGWLLGCKGAEMEEPMKSVISKMRADFVRVADARKARGDWSEADETEIGEAIKAAIDKGDPDMIHSWALWLADLSASIAAWELIVRGSMARMRAQAADERKAREAAEAAQRKGRH